MNIEKYFADLIEVHDRGNATEHSYRANLQSLFDQIDPDIKAQNEPERLRDVGAPDFSFHKGDVIVGHAEAKKLGGDLKGYIKKEGKEQYNRYRKALPNLIYTDGLTFLFLKNGEIKHEVVIGQNMMGWESIPDAFDALTNALKDFAAQRPQTIRSPATLAKLMSGKAALIKDILRESLVRDADNHTELVGQYMAFKEHLIHDITPGEFADIYAETVAYGLFAARLHDDTLEDFTRQEALDLLPKSNPFLRNLFGYIAGPSLDDRIKWIIDDLTDVFQACDVKKLMEGFGSLTQRRDPFIHFYEDFLKQYNPQKKEARGVWYTPEPVVSFIVRAVDEVLQTDFGLPMGLADTSKITVDWDTGQADKNGKPVKIKKEVHRVQVLDPATGTGTFLAEVTKQIANRVKDIAPGQWSTYVEKDLIPRLHGFELLMASYAMCHMKIDMMLTQMGYQPSKKPPRLSVYLTNSLEEGEREVRDLFMAQWLTNEAREANTIKRQAPIMCVIGNPPYSGESKNKSDWIMGLMEAYKKEPGGKARLNERNPKWINDDYVKFIRLAEHLISKNGEGIIGFITNHSYLDNPTFRGMRWHLLKNFDKIYVLDLHGNAKKKEVTPEGKPDKNVFDIQQGVAILIGVKKKGGQKPMANLHHLDLWGDRSEKYMALNAESISSPLFKLIKTTPPLYSFVERDLALQESFEEGFSLSALFRANSVGIVTARDSLTIDQEQQKLWTRVKDFAHSDGEDARIRYQLGKDVQDWSVDSAQQDLLDDLDSSHLEAILYRPFDRRWTYYTGKSRGFICRPRKEVMSHFTRGDNLSLVVGRQGQVVGSMTWNLVTVSKEITDFNLFYRGGGVSFPLYLYPDKQELDQTRQVNFDSKLWGKLQKKAKHPERGKPDEVQTFDYIYGVLHCPAFRETYAEYLKIDFPRIPWPKTADIFWSISDKGAQLRQLHLMQSKAGGPTPCAFEGDGNSIIEKIAFKEGRVWINKTQSFAKVPKLAWDFYIGGYQPAQKWLKDRRGLTLNFEDVMHYQQIIRILAETDRIMRTIEMDLN